MFSFPFQQEGHGMAESEQQEGHEGDQSQTVTAANQKSQQKQSRRKPGQSKEERTLGSMDDKVQRRLKTVDSSQKEEEQEREEQEQREADLYEHIKVNVMVIIPHWLLLEGDLKMSDVSPCVCLE